mgnify:CR=1 FL=1
MRLSSKVSSSDRCAVVAQLSRNRLARSLIKRALVDTKGLRRWATGNGCLPARQFPVALLGVGMPEAVRILDPRIADLAVVAISLLNEVLVRWDQRATFGEFPDFLEESPVLVCPDWHRPRPTTLGPAGLQFDVLVRDRVVRSELNGFLAPQAKGGLQPEAQPDVWVRDLPQLFFLEFPGLRFGGNLAAVADVVGAVVLRDHVALADLPGPPPQAGHAVLERADAEALVFPQGDQGLNVFRL